MLRKIFKDEKGSTIVEVAVLLPLLIGLFIFSIYFIEITRSATMMEVATTEGARTYAITGDKNLAIQKASQIIDNSISLIGGDRPKVYLEDNNIYSERNIYNFSIAGFDIHAFKIKQGREFVKEPESIYYKKPNAPGTTGNPHRGG